MAVEGEGMAVVGEEIQVQRSRTVAPASGVQQADSTAGPVETVATTAAQGVDPRSQGTRTTQPRTTK